MTFSGEIDNDYLDKPKDSSYKLSLKPSPYFVYM